MGSFLQERLMGPMADYWAWTLAQPLQTQIAMLMGLLVVTVLFLKTLTGMLNSRRPPCVGGIPIIGGFLKFIKVGEGGSRCTSGQHGLDTCTH